MAIHSSVLAWRIPWTEEPGGLQSMGSSKSWPQPSNLHFDFTYVFNVVKSSFKKKKHCLLNELFSNQFSSVTQSCLTL